MTADATASTTARRGFPAELSPTGKLVYRYLAEGGSATAEELKEALGVPQIRLYPAIDALEREDLLSRRGEVFAAAR